MYNYGYSVKSVDVSIIAIRASRGVMGIRLFA